VDLLPAERKHLSAFSVHYHFRILSFEMLPLEVLRPQTLGLLAFFLVAQFASKFPLNNDKATFVIGQVK